MQRNTYIFKYMTRLSPRTHQLIEKLFSAVDQANVTCLLLKECGRNLPLQKDTDEYDLERIRFAALKISNGDTLNLHKAIGLARRDWHDLLMCAGFGDSLSAHEKWAKRILEKSK
jgi:hypothetical protein